MQGHKVGGESARYLRFLFSLDDKGVLFYNQKKTKTKKNEGQTELGFTAYNVQHRVHVLGRVMSFLW